MKVTAPNDLHGRMIRCTNRATLIAETLQAFSTSEVERQADALEALGDVAEELADELEAIENAYVRESNHHGLAVRGGAR